jgi:hypothetical protein
MYEAKKIITHTVYATNETNRLLLTTKGRATANDNPVKTLVAICT